MVLRWKFVKLNIYTEKEKENLKSMTSYSILKKIAETRDMKLKVEINSNYEAIKQRK